MSVHFIYRGNGGAKFMRPIHTREEYLSLRNGGEQRQLGAAMCVQECGAEGLDWIALLEGWTMARG